MSRRDREARQRRRLYIGLSVASALVVGILVFSTLNEYVFKPRAVVASVNDVDIRRRDYWKVRSVDLINQINQYQQFAQLVDASQQQQYITLAQQASTELDDVWGSTSLDETTLNRMVEDEIYLQNMEELGLEVADADVERYIDAQFQPADAPLISPTPTPTLIPQRAEWATQTVVAEAGAIDGTATPTPVGDASPVASSTSESDGTPSDPSTPMSGLSAVPASPLASPVGIAIGASPIASPIDTDGSPQAASPSAEDLAASPEGSPVASPVVPEGTVTSPTPNTEQALQTAEAGYDTYQDNVFDTAHLSENDYERLIVRPAVAREKVRETLTKDVGQTAEQIRAAHILVDTKDLADTIYQTLQDPSVSFEQTARDQSNDTATAPNGGDLGWFARGQMVDAFEQTAFSQDIGTFSAPVQTEFGWHIIRVYEKDPNRALSDQQIEQYRENLVTDWVALQRADMDVSSDIEPSPTPGVSNFVPPADAPPPPAPTEEAVASPIVDEPTLSPDASPVAEASPMASALSAASPIVETVASPVAAATQVPVATAVPIDSAATPIASPDTADEANATPIAIGSASPVATPPATPSV